MPYTFYEEDAGEKCEWCRENIGPDGKGWNWSLDQGFTRDDGTYRQTNVYIHIDDEIDATAYKLRWVE